MDDIIKKKKSLFLLAISTEFIYLVTESVKIKKETNDTFN